MKAKIFFVLGFLFALTPFASPPTALAVGLAFGLIFTHPFSKQAKSFTKKLLQICVVGLGFGMNLHQVVRYGRSGIVYTSLGITLTLALGILLGRALKIGSVDAFLIAIGTAICGGSAIAAVGPIVDATDEELSVSLGTVFILNSVALLTFPFIGFALKLSQSQFGLWAALAIHDTSSVVGASARYGTEALAVGTAVKLARAVWIAPVSLGTAVAKRSGMKIHWPWFILFFALAAMMATYIPAGHAVFGVLSSIAKVGLTVTLYLIGSNISRATLKTVGTRPLLQALTLWVLVSIVTLALIRTGVIGL